MEIRVDETQDWEAIRFIYEYTRDIVSANEVSIKASDTKLICLGAMGVVYTIAVSALLSGIAAIILAIMVSGLIVGVARGLLPQCRFAAADPETLLDKRTAGRTARELQIIAVKTWIYELPEYDTFRDKKADIVRFCLVLAAVINISFYLSLVVG